MGGKPLLFLVFNRPDTTKQVFEAIRQVKPAKLYVAADGPRLNREKDKRKVLEVRDIATNVDWACEVKTLFRDNNQGCKKAVSSAIEWFFEHEEEGIILEDDCVPDRSFFHFCSELLDRYRDDRRIMAISGDNFQQGRQRTEYSYYFSRIPHCWGWATWKRAWKCWDGKLDAWPEIDKSGLLNDIAGGDKPFVEYWSGIFNRCYAGRIDSWAYPWTFSCWIQSGLTILPNENLVSNIGFGEEATHTTKANDMHAVLAVGNMTFPLRHPPYIIRDSEADRFTDRHNFGITESVQPLVGRILRRILEKIDLH